MPAHKSREMARCDRPHDSQYWYRSHSQGRALRATCGSGVSAPLIDFNEIVERRDVPLRHSRLLRHDGDEGASEWRRGRVAFGHFASYQSSNRSPYNNCRYAFHFIPDLQLDDSRHTALFVGATQIGEEWTFDGRRLPLMSTDEALERSLHQPDRGVHAYDLQWMPAFDDLVERVVIAWANPRAWSQWARGPKEIVELRRRAQEPPFPGYLDLVTTIDQVPLLWHSWRVALEAVRGIYLLVHPDGDQYVGSAYGEGGFYRRWLEYASNGHGGNLLLRERGSANYTVSILEVASSQMTSTDILARESSWKTRLGSRAHGLNAN